MLIDYEKKLSQLCLGICIFSTLLYVYLTIENLLNISEILLFSVLICSTLIIGVFFQNRTSTKEKRVQNLHKMWSMLFFFYIFQLIYILFFASEFARDYVDLYYYSYMEALEMQWEYGTNLTPFATIEQMINIFSLPQVDNQIAIMNLFGNFIVFMPFSFFFILLTNWANHPVKFLSNMALFIIFVEVLQFVTLSGTMDIDDFILNFSGVLVSYIILRYTSLSTYISSLLT